VISARIVASSNGAVDEIHLLTTTDVTPKQTVRNVESALMAHLGMRVSHKKISVATSDDPTRSTRAMQTPVYTPAVTMPAVAAPTPSHVGRPVPALGGINGRRIYFEDVEVRRSRSKGVACRVTLKKGDETYIGESEGMENERIRIELAARAALSGDSAGRGRRSDSRARGVQDDRRVRAEFRVCGRDRPREPGEYVGDGQRGDSRERGDGECAGGPGCNESLARQVNLR
jgi:hypothetical protein